MKKKLKKLSKQWKIENEDVLELDYVKDDDKKFQIPKHFKTIDEFFFFGDDLDLLIRHKRTSANVHEALNRFFLSNKQTVKRGIGKNLDILICEVKMNRACTVVYAWWGLPLNIDEIQDEVVKKIELNLNQSVPFIRGYLTREIGLKYAPEIRFMRDTYQKDYDEFEKYIDSMKQDSKKKLADKEHLISKKEQTYFKNIGLGPELLDYLANGPEKQVEMKKYLETNKLNNLYDYFKAASENAFDFKRSIDMAKEHLGIKQEHIDKIDENYIKQTEKLRKTKTDIKLEKQKAKVFKKLKITDEMQKEEVIDYQEVYYNYVNTYERKIPKNSTFGLNMHEASKLAEKGEEREGRINRKYKNSLRDAVKQSEKLVKGKKNKAEEFWKSLDNAH
jgi:ribosome-binding factor A